MKYLKIPGWLIEGIEEIACRRVILIMYTVIPLLVFIVVPLVYVNSALRDIPVGVIDNDRSDVSSALIKYIEASPSMRICRYYENEPEMREGIINNEIYAGFIFQEKMSEEVKKGVPSYCTAYINSSNPIICNSILNDVTKIIKTVSAGVLLKKFRAAGFSEDQSMNIILPVKLETQILYNPGYSYTDYLIPGVLTFIYMMIIICGAILAFHNNMKNFFKRSLAHLSVHVLNNLILIGIIFYLFKINIAGSAILLIIYLILFSFTSFAAGIMISAIFKKQMTALQACLFIFTPAFIYSGLTFPLWAMPEVHQVIGAMIPFTAFLRGLLKIYLMNSSFILVLRDMVQLLGFLVLFSSVTFVLLKIRKRYGHIQGN